MKYDYVKKIITDHRMVYTFTENTTKGEHVAIELSDCSGDQENKQSIPYLWKKTGFHDTHNKPWIGISTYVTHPAKGCMGHYNPQIGNDGLINPDWILEATPENREKIIKEIFNRANA